MTIDAHLLRRSPIFAELSDRELRRLAPSLRVHEHAAGETIVEEGSGAVGFFVLLDGSAEVSVAGEPRARLSPGAFFGEIALLDEGHRRTATITALEPTTCAAMTAWEFRPFVAEHPGAAWHLLRSLAQRVSDDRAVLAGAPA